MATIKTLLSDSYAPITSRVGFLKAPIEAVRRTLLGWRTGLGDDVVIKDWSRTFPESLRGLEPLALVGISRELVLATSSDWCAYFNNGWRGTDCSGIAHLGSLLGCPVMRVSCIPNTLGRAHDRRTGRYGATLMEVHLAPGITRAVETVNDGGRWVFVDAGDPFPFEDVDGYRSRRIRERFTPEMLEACTAELGVQYFDPGFYLNEGFLLQNRTQERYAQSFMSLDESRAKHGLPPAPK